MQTYIPYIKGAGIEHVVSVLSPRGGEHHQILDSFEGVAASESTIATQLGAITGQVADAKDEAGYAGTAPGCGSRPPCSAPDVFGMSLG